MAEQLIGEEHYCKWSEDIANAAAKRLSMPGAFYAFEQPGPSQLNLRRERPAPKKPACARGIITPASARWHGASTQRMHRHSRERGRRGPPNRQPRTASRWLREARHAGAGLEELQTQRVWYSGQQRAVQAASCEGQDLHNRHEAAICPDGWQRSRSAVQPDQLDAAISQVNLRISRAPAEFALPCKHDRQFVPAFQVQVRAP